jgi:hypothetical protein
MASHGEGLRPSSVVPVLVPIDPLADQALRPGRVELLHGLLVAPPILAVLFGEPDPFGRAAGSCRIGPQDPTLGDFGKSPDRERKAGLEDHLH